MRSGLDRTENPGWLLDETASAGRENLDPTHVSRYDDKENADAPAEIELLASLGVDADSAVIDIGAGTGQFTVAAAPRCRHVTAIDISDVMLDRLRTKVAGIANVSVEHAGFLTFDDSRPAVDAVYSRYALHHLPDFWKVVALQRIHRVLRPGGIFRLWDVVYGFPAADAADRIEQWCATGGSDVGSDWLRPEMEEHVRNEHSTFSWLLEPMIESAGFAIDRSEYSEDGFAAKYILTKR